MRGRIWLRDRIRNRSEFFAFSVGFNLLIFGIVFQVGVVPVGSLFNDTLPNQEFAQPTQVGFEFDAFEIKNDGWPSLFSYRPDGVSPKRVSEDCWVEELNRKIRQNAGNVFRQAQALENYYMRCRDQLVSGRERGVNPVVDYMNLNYPLSELPEVRAVTYRLPDGRVITGMLALQKSAKPRPFVIVKCGMFCNASESSNPANSFMHLYEESDFHVLILANIASQDFEILNGGNGIAIGGFDEGAQIYQLAKWLKNDSKFKQRISSIHSLGFSLGSHGVLYSGLYSSLNDPPGEKVINSVLAICPVVHLENSISGLFEGSWTGQVAGFIATREMRSVVDPEEHDDLKEDVLNHWIPDPAKVLDEVEGEIGHYYKDLTKKGWPFKPFKGQKIADMDQFWKANNYAKFADQVTVPTLILPAEDDGIVGTNENAALLYKGYEDTTSAVQVVTSQDGNHCAHSIANGWALKSGLIRNYILSHSPELKVKEKQKDVSADFRWQSWPYSSQLNSTEQFYGSYWRFKKGRDYATVDLDILQNSVPGCSYATGRPEECFRQIQAKIPLSQLVSLGVDRIPESRIEANRLTRYANTRFRLLNHEKQDIRSSNQKPVYISVFSL